MFINFSFAQAGTHAGKKGWSFEFYGQHRDISPYLLLPEIPQLYIDSDGMLIYNQGLGEDFSLVDGMLVVEGDQEEQYSMEQGNVLFDFN